MEYKIYIPSDKEKKKTGIKCPQITIFIFILIFSIVVTFGCVGTDYNPIAILIFGPDIFFLLIIEIYVTIGICQKRYFSYLIGFRISIIITIIKALICLYRIIHLIVIGGIDGESIITLILYFSPWILIYIILLVYKKKLLKKINDSTIDNNSINFNEQQQQQQQQPIV